MLLGLTVLMDFHSTYSPAYEVSLYLITMLFPKPRSFIRQLTAAKTFAKMRETLLLMNKQKCNVCKYLFIKDKVIFLNI